MTAKEFGGYVAIAIIEAVLGIALWGFGAPSWAIFGFCYILYFLLVVAWRV